MKDGFEVEQAFVEFYGPLVYLFMKSGFTREDARDLAQDTFVRVYRGRGGYGGRASPETWIRQIARNVLKNELRRRNALMRSGEETSLGEADNEETISLDAGADKRALELVLEEERSQLLYGAIEKLPPKMQRCMRLHLEGLSHSEIGARLKITTSTVKTQLFDARAQLKQKLERHFPEFEDQISMDGEGDG